jgi:hypothetical protein
MPAALKYFNAGATGAPDSILVIPVTMVAMCLGMPLSGRLQGAVGLPGAMAIGSVIMTAGVYLASLATSLKTFILA